VMLVRQAQWGRLEWTCQITGCRLRAAVDFEGTRAMDGAVEIPSLLFFYYLFIFFFSRIVPTGYIIIPVPHPSPCPGGYQVLLVLAITSNTCQWFLKLQTSTWSN
jgi:hypothetical protein